MKSHSNHSFKNALTKFAVSLFSDKVTSDTLPLICKIMNHAIESKLQKMAADYHPNLDAFKSTADGMIAIANLVYANNTADLIRTKID